MDEGNSENDEGREDEPQELTPQRPLMQLLKRSHGRITRTLGRRMLRLRLRKKDPEDAHTEGMKAKIEDKIKKKKEKGEGVAAVAGVGRVIGEDRVVEQLVDDQLVVHSRRTMYDYADR